MKKLIRSLTLSLAAVTVLATASPAAEPALPPIFSNGMVLQRDMPLPVWGTAADGTEVTVTLGDAKATATAAGGKWEAKLPAQKASKEPRKLTVSFKGGKEIVIEDVLVGEVWLCAGQSNMAQVINKRAPRDIADMPTVRQFSRDRGKGSQKDPYWRPAAGETMSQMSVTAVYFAENLHKELDVPVGLVLTAVSGTPIEEWTPRAQLDSDAGIKANIAKMGDRENRKKLTAMRKSAREGTQVDDPDGLFAIQHLARPGRLYSVHIEPTVPFAIRGVIWYQGEANSKLPENSNQYAQYLALLIAGLRQEFQQPDLPFYAVQLPSINDNSKDGKEQCVYHLVRLQQLKAIQATPNTGLAVSIDVNEGLHPPSKHLMGDRLAKLALAEVYGKKTGDAFGGPLLKDVKFEGPKAICTFDHAEGGLTLKEDAAGLFEIAGKNGDFVPAKATVEGDKLVVQSTKVKEAAAVRYAHKPFMETVSLFGATGLPASPFVHPADAR